MPSTIEPGASHNFAQLMTRISETLPAYRNGEWSPLERGIFNGLLANVVQRQGPSAITPEVLNKIQDDMTDVIRQYQTWQLNE